MIKVREREREREREIGASMNTLSLFYDKYHRKYRP